MTRPLVILFGYDSSLFTQKVQHVLRYKQIPYTYITVPSMMPRPILRDNFNVTYRKIPVLTINRDMYIDTSIICEALEHRFSESSGHPSIYPPTSSGMRSRSLIRGVASYWADRPLFRATCGLMPTAVWRSKFGRDRAQLIGHKLDPDKLQRKMPEKLSEVDMHCGMLEEMLEGAWMLDTVRPSMADISWYVQLDWGRKNSHGQYVDNLTAGDAETAPGDLTMDPVFNAERYPKLWRWYNSVQGYLEGRPPTVTKIDGSSTKAVSTIIRQLQDAPTSAEIPIIPTSATPFDELDARSGLVKGAAVAITPNDTGRDDPTVGTFLAASPEEVVISPAPIDGQAAPTVADVRLHFPRLGFVVRPVDANISKPRL